MPKILYTFICEKSTNATKLNDSKDFERIDIDKILINTLNNNVLNGNFQNCIYSYYN